tara:strand:- start:1803 stop:1943 length:141 start_codon:yes stop_codon:yes gene_type:complete
MKKRFEGLFYFAGTIAFSAITVYLIILMWKCFVWWQWLHKLNPMNI